MRALVTGASGFVGRHLTERLQISGYEVVAAGGPDDESALAIDLLDPHTLRAAFDLARPDVVFHLAAQASVSQSIAAPHETYAVNVIGTANVLSAMRDWQNDANARARLLFTSSAEVYGIQPPEAMPLRESTLPSPANPYAASKAAAEAIVLAQRRCFGVDAIVTRAFNHIGPGQDERFAAANFAAQLAAIAKGGEPVLRVGNLESRRDFLDVRDVVSAYVALAEHGEGGEIYNVCSGAAVPMREVLRMLIEIAHVPVRVEQDPQRTRAADVPVLYGDATKLREKTGWAPQYSLRETLRDTYASVSL